MSATIILGAQWGDEGKGKIVDILASGMDMVIRFQGGANAGHTLVVQGEKTVLHQIPSGVMNQKCMNVIACGCVIDPVDLVEEIENVKNKGVRLTPDNLALSSAAHLVTPMHKLIDRTSGSKVGTTGRGIGPCYADKIARIGIRLENLIDNTFENMLKTATDRYFLSEPSLPENERTILHDDLRRFCASLESLRDYVKDTQTLISNAAASGRKILCEGAQGTLLDIDHGTYPFVTSSSTTIGGAYTGTGVFMTFESRIAVIKAYSTRVGNGPFPTELNDEIGEKLRRTGREFGATTGRPRRCGWLDLPLLKKSVQINGFNRIALTKLDCLTGLNEIFAATGRDSTNNPDYKVFPGWNIDISDIRSFSDLPQECKSFLLFIEEFLGIPVAFISVGSDRRQTIERNIYES